MKKYSLIVLVLFAACSDNKICYEYEGIKIQRIDYSGASTKIFYMNGYETNERKPFVEFTYSGFANDLNVDLVFGKDYVYFLPQNYVENFYLDGKLKEAKFLDSIGVYRDNAFKNKNFDNIVSLSLDLESEQEYNAKFGSKVKRYECD